MALLRIKLRKGKPMNKKNQSTALQFPKIYRFITEKIKNAEGDLRIMVIGFISGGLLTLIALSSLYLVVSLREKAEIENKKKVVISQIDYWEKVTEKQKGYRDGYFMLAVLWYQLGDFNKSEEYLNNALDIDPNFSPARDLQKVLDRREP